MTDTSMKVVLKILLLPFSNADMRLLRRTCLKELYDFKRLGLDKFIAGS